MTKALILMLLPLFLTAQRYTVLDTAYTVNTGGVFFEIHDVTYSTGEQITEKTLIGDTTAYFNANFGRFQQEAERMAVLAQKMFDAGKRLNDLKKENNKILSATGLDILDTISDRSAAAFTETGWKIRDTAAADIDFSINANGQLRYQIQGFQARNADLFGDAIILNNYKDSGNDAFLFKTESGTYRNREGNILLRKPGGAANRAAIEKEELPVKRPAPNLKPVKKRKKN